MSGLLAFALLLGRLSPEGTIRSDWDGVRAQILDQAGCTGEGTCVALDVHLLQSEGQAIQDAKWWRAQMEFSRRVFAPVQIDFQVRTLRPLEATYGNMDTREDRDSLLSQATSRDGVDVFVVRRLADVDKAGAFIRGVHWRRRDQTSKRWVIVSSIAEPGVLAHELGHFFGLPHSRYRVSLMNKTPRLSPPWAKRVFAEPELVRVKEHRDRMLKTQRLRHQGKR